LTFNTYFCFKYRLLSVQYFKKIFQKNISRHSQRRSIFLKRRRSRGGRRKRGETCRLVVVEQVVMERVESMEEARWDESFIDFFFFGVIFWW
jgi:hypothetical protein